MKNRRKSRILALQGLYAYDLRHDESYDVVFNTLIEGKKFAADVVDYARFLIQSASAHSPSIDAMLQQHTNNWDIRRMSAIDRNILRMAVAELTASDTVPFRVVIDEAVELAKKFGTNESGKFVNGVLDAVHKHLSMNSGQETSKEEPTAEGRSDGTA
ncbi:MAG: transcription antitermination factor NusB [Chitinivibrionales bacterium]|nr:transcription antitermination factor NusB [Chitinivibrionales bacterium]